MGLKDFMNNAANAARDKATSIYEDKKADVQQNLAVADQKKEIAAERKGQFNPVKTIGDIAIDDNNRLFRVKRATGDIKKSHGILAKTARATVALGTLGASEAVAAAMKPSDKIFTFDELAGY